MVIVTNICGLVGALLLAFSFSDIPKLRPPRKMLADAKKHKPIKETTRVRYVRFWPGVGLIGVSYLLPLLSEVGVF